MNASELLGGREVELLFRRLASIDTDDRVAIGEVARELEARVTIEERTLFPIARTTEQYGNEADETVAAAMIARLESGTFDPKLSAVLERLDVDLDLDADVDHAELEAIGGEIARRVERALIASTIVGGRGRRQRQRGVRMAARRR